MLAGSAPSLEFKLPPAFISTFFEVSTLRGVIACLPGVGVLGPHAPSVRSERVATVSAIFFIDVSVDIESYRSEVRQAYLPR